MSRTTPQIRALSERLIAQHAQALKSNATKPGAFAVCIKLEPHLATLMGRSGFQSLLARALMIARGQVDWLHTVTVTEDGALGISDEVAGKVDAKVWAEGSVILVAQLLGLLVTFIGENLTLRLVGEVWPTLPLNDPRDLK